MSLPAGEESGVPSVGGSNEGKTLWSRLEKIRPRPDNSDTVARDDERDADEIFPRFPRRQRVQTNR